MRFMPLRIRSTEGATGPDSSLLLASLAGIKAWIIFGLIETSFLVLVPWTHTPSNLYRGYHPGFTLLLFVLYTATGGLLATGSWLCLRRLIGGSRPETHRLPGLIRSSAICSLSVFYAASRLFFLSVDSWTTGGLFLSTLVLVGAVLSCVDSSWLRNLRYFQSAWMVSIVLLGPPCIASNLRNEYAATLTIAFALGAVITSYLLCRWVPHKLTSETPVSTSPRRLAALAPLGLVVVAVCWLGFFVRQQPLEQSVSLGPVPLGQPHVLLIVLDTVRADHLSVYGYKRETTPNLRELAVHATLYTRAVSSGDRTLPTHASLFTGLYGASHGAHSGPNNHNENLLANRYDTLAEILSTHGYQTAAVVANIGYLAPRWGVAQGFSLYDHRSPIPFLGQSPAYSLRRTMQAILSRLSAGGNWRPWFPRAEEINDQVYPVLDRLGNHERPIFLFVNYMDGHWPYLPPAPFDTLYPGKAPGFDERRYREVRKQVLSEERDISEAERNHLVSQYDGAIAYLDDQVGQGIARATKKWPFI